MNRILFKLKCLLFGNSLIDDCFPNNDIITNRIINTTCKYIFKNKLNEIDLIINLFADNNGEIDICDFVNYMKENLIGENGLKINLRDYINQSSSMINIIPDKTIIINKEDLNIFLENLRNTNI